MVLKGQELATVLVALRYVQRAIERHEGGVEQGRNDIVTAIFADYADILDGFNMMNANQIDELCEKLNDSSNDLTLTGLLEKARKVNDKVHAVSASLHQHKRGVDDFSYSMHASNITGCAMKSTVEQTLAELKALSPCEARGEDIVLQ